MEDQPTYYPIDSYNRLVATLGRIPNALPSLKIGVCAWTGTKADQIKIALGEQSNVWPETILDHFE